MEDETRNTRRKLFEEAVADGTIKEPRDAYFFGIGVGISGFTSILEDHDIETLKEETKIADGEGCDELASFMNRVIGVLELYK